jgi:LysM repeat protein
VEQVSPSTRPTRAPKTRAFLGAVAIAACVLVGSPAVAAADDGYATWYGPGFQGNVMYDGQIYDMYDPTTTASNIYPLGTWLKVTNPANGHSVVVQVRDRGAFHHTVDLSYAAFKILANPAAMGIPITYQVVTGPGGQPAAASPTPSRAAPSSRGSRPAPATQYAVQPGDTLSGIAATFNIDQQSLAAWNGITDPNSLSPGQTLRLTAPPAPAPAPAAAGGSTYVVKLGDTLLAIAVQLGVSADQLAAANGLTDPFPIVEGQTLVVPTAPAAPRPAKYTVQPGDTIDGIASALGVSADSLQSLNQIIDASTLQPGAVLVVPSP